MKVELLDVQRIISEEPRSIKKSVSKDSLNELKSIDNLKVDLQKNNLKESKSFKLSPSKESLAESKSAVNIIKAEMTEAQKLASKESRSKRLSASRESLKMFEKKVQSLSTSSKELEVEPNQQSQSTPQDTDFKSPEKSMPPKDNSRSKLNIELLAFVEKKPSNPDLLRTKTPVIKRSESFTRDMEIPKMSGKYTTDANNSKTSASSLAFPTEPPTKLPNVYTVKLPQTRIRAATISPTRQISFSTPNQNNSPLSNALSQKKIYTPTSSESKIEINQNIVKSSSFSDALISTYEEKVPFSVKSAISNITANKADMNLKQLPTKINNQESISRIPTPVKTTSTFKAISEVHQLPLNKTFTPEVMKPTLPLDTQVEGKPAIKLSMLDRIRNFEKQAQK